MRTTSSSSTAWPAASALERRPRANGITGYGAVAWTLSPRTRPAGPPPPLRFSATGYLWVSSISGRSATIPPLPAAKVSLRFTDIPEDLNGGIMGVAEARWDRFSIVTDLMVSKVTSGGGLPGPYFSRVRLTSDTFLQAMATYRLVAVEAIDIDLARRRPLVGAR